MNAGARADGTKMLHDRCHRWHLPGTARGSPRHRGDTRPMLHTAFAPRGPLMPDSAQHMVQTAPWLKNRTSNLLERISFSVSRINNSHTEVASFSAFLWPSPNFRSLREKHTRSWKIRPATHISFELKAPPNQDQWAVWFGPAWIRVWESYSRFAHITLGLFSLQPPLHPGAFAASAVQLPRTPAAGQRGSRESGFSYATNLEAKWALWKQRLRKSDYSGWYFSTLRTGLVKNSNLSSFVPNKDSIEEKTQDNKTFPCLMLNLSSLASQGLVF